MKTFDEYYWHQFDVLNKDTQLARQFGQDVWDYKQNEIDELQKRINLALAAVCNNKCSHTIIDILKGATP